MCVVKSSVLPQYVAASFWDLRCYLYEELLEHEATHRDLCRNFFVLHPRRLRIPVRIPSCSSDTRLEFQTTCPTRERKNAFSSMRSSHEPATGSYQLLPVPRHCQSVPRALSSPFRSVRADSDSHVTLSPSAKTIEGACETRRNLSIEKPYSKCCTVWDDDRKCWEGITMFPKMTPLHGTISSQQVQQEGIRSGKGTTRSRSNSHTAETSPMLSIRSATKSLEPAPHALEHHIRLLNVYKAQIRNYQDEVRMLTESLSSLKEMNTELLRLVKDHEWRARVPEPRPSTETRTFESAIAKKTVKATNHTSRTGQQRLYQDQISRQKQFGSDDSNMCRTGSGPSSKVLKKNHPSLGDGTIQVLQRVISKQKASQATLEHTTSAYRDGMLLSKDERQALEHLLDSVCSTTPTVFNTEITGALFPGTHEPIQSTNSRMYVDQLLNDERLDEHHRVQYHQWVRDTLLKFPIPK